ncbi:hypothetical protein GCM10010873_21970 [Cypionkella aquatica]|uniref:Uncharacterized protein n=1 Tax=Cypionkella aquatica TaxID=1756042 RepID=A0AA37TTJ3_9RHOB|nr:hypothetical protein [Cypionkella aquatica]GLS87223.1 hypothetical protein GCM10010873_21970 [Cypionkella aquatica]
MTPLLSLGSDLIALLARPLPSLAAALLPACIAVAGIASLRARSDDRILAWVQIITSIALTLWMLAPWHPTEADVLGMNRSMTLFSFGYVLQDWLREAWRSGLHPRWAHLSVILSAALLVAALAYTAFSA